MSPARAYQHRSEGLIGLLLSAADDPIGTHPSTQGCSVETEVACLSPRRPFAGQYCILAAFSRSPGRPFAVVLLFSLPSSVPSLFLLVSLLLFLYITLYY